MSDQSQAVQITTVIVTGIVTIATTFCTVLAAYLQLRIKLRDNTEKTEKVAESVKEAKASATVAAIEAKRTQSAIGGKVVDIETQLAEVQRQLSESMLLDSKLKPPVPSGQQPAGEPK